MALSIELVALEDCRALKCLHPLQLIGFMRLSAQEHGYEMLEVEFHYSKFCCSGVYKSTAMDVGR